MTGQEAGVGENSRAIAASLIGAVIGGVAGYLLFTEHGRALRRQIEPALEDIARELSSFRSTVRRAGDVADEGRRLLDDALSDTRPRYPGPHQTAPF
jgi:gas vesicle protein